MTTSRPTNISKSSLVAQPISYRFTRHHSALQVGDTLTVQSKREEPVSVFIGQSALDSACGVHCAAMMLILFDLAKSSALLEMHRRKFGIVSKLFSAFYKTYFEGVNADEYVTILESLNLPLQMTLRTDKDKCKTGSVDAFAVDCLMRGELLAIAIASVNNRRTKHWVLGIGVEGAVCGRDSIPDGLLLLDPSASAPPPFSVSNARLRISKEGRISPVNKLAEKLYKKAAKLSALKWTYESSDWRSEPMRITAAVRFRLNS